MKNVGGSLSGPGIHVELLLGEGRVGKMPELLMMLFPLASSRDMMNSVPATNGKKLSAIPVEKLVSCRGITTTVELKGRIVKEAGIPETDEVDPEKEISNGAHCQTLVELNWRLRTGATSVPNASKRNSRPARSSMVERGAQTCVRNRGERELHRKFRPRD